MSSVREDRVVGPYKKKKKTEITDCPDRVGKNKEINSRSFF